MYEGFYGWSLENIYAGTVETKYTVEYINDQNTWEKFDKTEDIELYSKREYDNISDAITFYLTWFVSDKCYDIKLWEQVFVNGEMVLEQSIDPNSTLIDSMRWQIDKDMRNRICQTETIMKDLSKQNDLLLDFIKYTKQENLFDQFRYMKAEEK